MNFYTVALLVALWQMMKNNKQSNSPLDGLLNADTKNIVDNLQTLFSGSGDKTNAILSVISSPLFATLTESIFGKNKDDANKTGNESTCNNTQSTASNFDSANLQNETNCCSNTGNNTPQSENIFDSVKDIASEVMNAKNSYKQQSTTPLTNNEGYTFPKHSADSQDFFHPIDNIADSEVKNKLYWFYDNWYL